MLALVRVSSTTADVTFRAKNNYYLRPGAQTAPGFVGGRVFTQGTVRFSRYFFDAI